MPGTALSGKSAAVNKTKREALAGLAHWPAD